MSNSSSSSSVSSSSSRGGLRDDAAGRQQQRRRGQSLSANDKTKDEDLALFQDMRMREDSAFLHPSMMEMDQGSLTAKLGGLSGYRVSARKGSTDLLTFETDKNDYDWLLTPPGTPLFPCLERDLLVASPRQQRDSSRWTSKLSRLSSDAQAQAAQAPVSSSSSSSSRPTPRGSNPSPRRQSAPSTSKSKPVSPAASAVRPSTPTTRGRPSSSSASASSASAPRPSTPTGRARPSTPTRPSTAGIRPCTPTPRSSSTAAAGPSFIRPSTPTPTAGPGFRRPGASSSSSRGTSPLRLKPGQAPLACEPPPNLRTSAAERPSSNSRAATIPSRPAAAAAAAAAGNGVDVAMLRRQAALPILSRSYNAPHHQQQQQQHEREMSSFSRRAITSANEGAPIISRAPLEDDKSTAAYVKKQQQQQPVRSCGSRGETSFFGTSISKKSLDTAIRHMDIRRSSPGGFRPLMPNAATPLSSSSYSRATTVARNRLGNSAAAGCEERSQVAAAGGCAKQEDSHNLLVNALRRQGDVEDHFGSANSDLFTANGDDDLLLELSSSSLDDLSSYRRITDAGQELRILEEDYLTST